MKAKKLILFIVEGIWDQTCLALPLERLLKSETIRFALTYGDITTKDYATTANIEKRLGDTVKAFCDNERFGRTDLLQIVHLVDMDGAFISDDSVQYDAAYNNPFYGAAKILTSDVAGIIGRNKQKAAVLNKLITMSKVWKGVPYRVFFFSANMDHALHDNANLTDAEKGEKAKRFEKQYQALPGSLVAHLETISCSCENSYEATWSYIKAENHSLTRCSNFNVYFASKPSVE